MRTNYPNTREIFISDALMRDTDACIVWPFAVRKSSGYGAYNLPRSKENVDAHRHVCERAHGVPPSPLHKAAHGCNNHLCINPRHLRWATHDENMQDVTDAGSLRRPRGPYRTYNEADLRLIAAPGKSLGDLSRYFGKDRSYMGRLRRRVREQGLTPHHDIV